MEKIKYYLEKYRLIIVVAVVSIILLMLILCLIFNNTDKKITEDEEIEVDIVTVKEENIVQSKKVKVDIKGYVNFPGVYELDENKRVIDVINEAGGLKEGANTEYINLSKKVIDEMIIIIYSNSEVEKYKETDKQIIYIEYECICPDNINDACITSSDVVNTNEIDNIENNQIDEKISINKSSIEELITLNGIGESKAKAIVDYREKNGDFLNLEDIMNVPGIGESAYSKIKDHIKL